MHRLNNVHPFASGFFYFHQKDVKSHMPLMQPYNMYSVDVHQWRTSVYNKFAPFETPAIS